MVLKQSESLTCYNQSVKPWKPERQLEVADGFGWFAVLIATFLIHLISFWQTAKYLTANFFLATQRMQCNFSDSKEGLAATDAFLFSCVLRKIFTEFRENWKFLKVLDSGTVVDVARFLRTPFLRETSRQLILKVTAHNLEVC